MTTTRITAWRASHKDQMWGHVGSDVEPAALRDWLTEHAGETVVNYYGALLTVDPADPNMTYPLFRHVFDPEGTSVLVMQESVEIPGREVVP